MSPACSVSCPPRTATTRAALLMLGTKTDSPTRGTQPAATAAAAATLSCRQRRGGRLPQLTDS